MGASSGAAREPSNKWRRGESAGRQFERPTCGSQSGDDEQVGPGEVEKLEAASWDDSDEPPDCQHSKSLRNLFLGLLVFVPLLAALLTISGPKIALAWACRSSVRLPVRSRPVEDLSLALENYSSDHSAVLEAAEGSLSTRRSNTFEGRAAVFLEEPLASFGVARNLMLALIRPDLAAQ